MAVGAKKPIKKAETKATASLFGCYAEVFDKASYLDIVFKSLIQKSRLYPQSISIRFSSPFS